MKSRFFLLGLLQLITALGAIPAGWAYLADPSGNGMGVTPDLLKDSPFSDFLIPGLFLFLVNGAGNLAGAVLSFWRKTVAGPAGMILGALLVLWIILQVAWIGLSSFLQPAFFFVGLAMALLGYLIRRAGQIHSPGP